MVRKHCLIFTPHETGTHHWADSPDWTPANEDLKIHIEAANPENYITKSEARRLTKQIAYVLRDKYDIGASSLGKDVVLCTASGSPFHPCLFYGIVAAGGVFSGASTAFQTNELVRQINDAEAKLLMCSPEYVDRTIEAAKQSGIPLERILVIDSSVPKRWSLHSASGHSTVYQQGSGQQELDWPRLATKHDLEQTTTCLLYSSGTTGLPKGVLLSHWNLIADNICTMSVGNKYRARCKEQGRNFVFSTIAHLPMAHIAGIDMYSTNPFYMAGTTYWMKNFEFDSFIEYHRRYRPTFQL